ncbi:MAG: DUF6272 family protein [Bacteroidales bacterium]
MSSEKTLLKFTGFLTHNDITIITNNFMEKSKTLDISNSFARKIVVLIIEILENNFYYTKSIQTKLSEQIDEPFFSIVFNNKKFIITSVNPIRLEDVEPLKRRIEEINNCDIAFLKEIYLKKLIESVSNNKSSPGVGLIRLAKITKNKINCSFNQFDNKFLNYRLEIIVNSK